MFQVILLVILLATMVSHNQPTIVIVNVPTVQEYHTESTLGYVENRTDWILEVSVDKFVEFHLHPGEKVKLSLDKGEHLIEAEAYINTFNGLQSVGIFKGKFLVDGVKRFGGVYGKKLYGWRILLGEGGFRQW